MSYGIMPPKWLEQLTIPTMPTTTKDFDFTSLFLEILKRNLSFLDAVQDIKFNYSKRLGKITTTVLFKDGTKSTVAPKDGEFFDPQTGIEQAILKRFCGLSRSAYKKWLDKMAESGEKLLRDISEREIKDQTIKPEQDRPGKICSTCLYNYKSRWNPPCFECIAHSMWEHKNADQGRTELKPETAMAYPIRSCIYCRFKDVSALQYPCSECGNDKLRWEPEKDVNLFDGDEK